MFWGVFVSPRQSVKKVLHQTACVRVKVSLLFSVSLLPSQSLCLCSIQKTSNPVSHSCISKRNYSFLAPWTEKLVTLSELSCQDPLWSPLWLLVFSVLVIKENISGWGKYFLWMWGGRTESSRVETLMKHVVRAAWLTGVSCSGTCYSQQSHLARVWCVGNADRRCILRNPSLTHVGRA